MARYQVAQTEVSHLLEQVKNNQIAIPELQRPFVWDSVKVRDLMDSLYKGYPIGYLITWQSVGAAIKDGVPAAHQQILIDGQQRVTALQAAVVGLPVVNKKYQKKRIEIAFNPVTEEFETATPVIRKNPEWISDISELLNLDSTWQFINAYFDNNPDLDQGRVGANIDKLTKIKNAQIGTISLSDDIDVETVAEIFIRINSKGVALNSTDFAMSKIATYGDRGRNLRKLIDYFCHLAVAPHIYDDIVANDEEFASSPYMHKISWLRNNFDDLYDPGYNDVIRIAGLVGFGRGVVPSIVSELSGRDPATRKFDDARVPIAYDKLEGALDAITNKYNFENFLMILKSAGYIDKKMLTSTNAVNFAYALYLMLRLDPDIPEPECKRIVRRWFVMSMLTQRASGSFESRWDTDMRRIKEAGPAEYLRQIEDGELSDSFWEAALPISLATNSSKSPYFQAFLASQVASNARGFLSKSITVRSMLEQSGDLHHIVPKDYLQKNGVGNRRDYNQIANYVQTETSINISISNKAPSQYMAEVDEQINTGNLRLGEITTREELEQNLRENAVPESVNTVTAASYQEFLIERRKLMALAIRDYYRSL